MEANGRTKKIKEGVIIIIPTPLQAVKRVYEGERQTYLIQRLSPDKLPKLVPVWHAAPLGSGTLALHCSHPHSAVRFFSFTLTAFTILEAKAAASRVKGKASSGVDDFHMPEVSGADL